MYGYIYKTTFPDGKLYIGQSAKYKEFNPSYHGSGIVVRKFCKNHNPNALITTLIEWCKDKQELNEKEIFWIKKLNTLEPYGHNISEGGNGGNLGELTNEKLTVLNQRNRMHGKHHSARTREIMSQKAKQIDKSYLSNYIFITDGIKTIKILKTEPIPEGFHRGRTFSQQTLENMKNAGKRKTEQYIERKKQEEIKKYGCLGLTREEKVSITIQKQLSKMTSEERKAKFGRPMSDENKKRLSDGMKGNQYLKGKTFKKS